MSSRAEVRIRAQVRAILSGLRPWILAPQRQQSQNGRRLLPAGLQLPADMAKHQVRLQCRLMPDTVGGSQRLAAVSASRVGGPVGGELRPDLFPVDDAGDRHGDQDEGGEAVETGIELDVGGMAHLHDGHHDAEEIDLDHGPFLEKDIGPEQSRKKGGTAVDPEQEGHREDQGKQEKRKDDGGDQDNKRDEIIAVRKETEQGIEDVAAFAHAQRLKGHEGEQDGGQVQQEAGGAQGKGRTDGIAGPFVHRTAAARAAERITGHGPGKGQEQVTIGTGGGMGMHGEGDRESLVGYL